MVFQVLVKISKETCIEDGDANLRSTFCFDGIVLLSPWPHLSVVRLSWVCLVCFLHGGF